MAIKTENLAIVMTDIVGFTEATVHQSRVDIDVLLDTHNRILLPIVRRYRGRHIKSIGDALLLVFRSPTDAMLCAMAMQDALYEYNRSRGKDRRIRIRVGASLGEVRVTRNDVFGEPVNLTSRITGITPEDEIYLSEALFMAMNKAEVPSQEVGWKELKGIGQPVRVYNIPRFAPARLVPDAMTTEDLSDLVYPYGGAHLSDEGDRVSTSLRRWRRGVGTAVGYVFGGATRSLASLWSQRAVRALLVVLVALPIVVMAVRYVGKSVSGRTQDANPSAGQVVALPPAASEPAPAKEARQPPVVTPKPEVASVSPPRTPAPAPKQVPEREPAPAPTPAPAPARTVAPPTWPPAPTRAPAASAPTQESPQSETASSAPPPAWPPPETPAAGVPEPAATPVTYTTISSAKSAYTNGKLSKTEYRRIIRELEASMDREVDQAKRDYRSGKITKAEYATRVREIKLRYR